MHCGRKEKDPILFPTIYSLSLRDEARGRVISLSLKKLIQNRILIRDHLGFQLCLSLRGESTAFLGFSKWYMAPKRSFIFGLEGNLSQSFQAMCIL